MNSTTSKAVAVAILFLAMLIVSPAMAQDRADSSPRLHLSFEGESPLGFQLSGLSTSDPGTWVLQSSTGLDRWSDLAVFPDKMVDGQFELELPTRVLRPRGLGAQYFRARRLGDDEADLIPFLSARNAWRLSGLSGYSFEVRYNISFLFWHGSLAVRDDEVVSFETIESNFFEIPQPKTIDDWFAELESAIAQRADSITVEYDPIYSFPKEVSIDPVEIIADDERGWSILRFLPHR